MITMIPLRGELQYTFRRHGLEKDRSWEGQG
jgi:hypothetical protein